MTAIPGEPSRGAFPEREFRFSRTEFLAIAGALRNDAGIDLSESKAPLVYSRLVKRLRALGLSSFKDYCALIGEQGGQERARMVGALTTNVTRFFREPHHFAHLKEKVLPRLISEARAGASVRIWSAGCSSGEEPYSIALTILSMMPDAPRYDVKILATDIDAEILGRAREGLYAGDTLRGVTLPLRNRWLSRLGRGEETAWAAGEEMRALVAFRTLNLLDPWPMKKQFQVIFCRNVVIYFEDEVRNQLWPRLAGVLALGGTLYVGHSERVVSDDQLFRVAGLTTYELSPSARLYRPSIVEVV